MSISAEPEGGRVQVILWKMARVPNRSGCEYRGYSGKWRECRTEVAVSTGEYPEMSSSAEPEDGGVQVIFWELRSVPNKKASRYRGIFKNRNQCRTRPAIGTGEYQKSEPAL